MKYLFLHGLSGSHHNFDQLRPYFEETEAFDLPGHGRAEKPRRIYDKHYLIQYVRARIHEPVVLVGHSMGAILAKDIALAYPELVRAVIAISYPLHSSNAALRRAVLARPLLGEYARETLLSKILCYSKHVWKWFFLPFIYLFNRERYPSIRDNFIHTNQAITSIIQDYLLHDDGTELQRIKEKTFLIFGKQDNLIDHSYARTFHHLEVPHMAHQFFNFEDIIAKGIKQFIDKQVCFRRFARKK